MKEIRHIVKRAGHNEPFDERKLYASIYSACLAVQVSQPEAENLAEQVVTAVKHATSHDYRLTSHRLKVEAAKALGYYHPNASYLYQHHHDLC